MNEFFKKSILKKLSIKINVIKLLNYNKNSAIFRKFDKFDLKNPVKMKNHLHPLKINHSQSRKKKEVNKKKTQKSISFKKSRSI